MRSLDSIDDKQRDLKRHVSREMDQCRVLQRSLANEMQYLE